MKIKFFQDPDLLAEELAILAYASSWKDAEITVNELDVLIEKNLQLIVSQVDNGNTAPQLQACMLALTKRISKESDTPEGRALAFKIQGYAQGIFNQGKKPDWSDLPRELWEKEIFSEIVPQDSTKVKSGLESLFFASKAMCKSALEAQKTWIDKEAISLRAYGCKTAKEAVQCVIDKKLTSANLLGFFDLAQEDLNKLIENCPSLKKLFISSFNIKDIPISQLKNLTSLNLQGCTQIPEEKLAEALCQLKNLTSLNLAGCYEITETNLAEFLSQLKNLTSLNLAWCSQIRGYNLAEALCQLKNLTSLNLAGWYENPGFKLVEALSQLKKLESLNLEGCYEIKGAKLAELKRKFPWRWG